MSSDILTPQEIHTLKVATTGFEEHLGKTFRSKRLEQGMKISTIVNDFLNMEGIEKNVKKINHTFMSVLMIEQSYDLAHAFEKNKKRGNSLKLLKHYLEKIGELCNYLEEIEKIENDLKETVLGIKELKKLCNF